MATELRTERDSFGEIDVPSGAYWGAQTQRSLEHFAIGAERMPSALVHAYGRLKRAAAEANAALGVLAPQSAEWIVQAAGEVVEGRHDAMFPLSVWQTGSGTQTNMNLNEVIANRANELAGEPLGSNSPVHPNDHVNLGQSSNDTFPTAMHVSAALEIERRLFPAIDRLLETLEAKTGAYATVLKIGRTHLQDATPVTLGQEIGGWAAQIRLARTFVAAVEPALFELAMSGTAVGTGLNAHPSLGAEVARRLAEQTDLPFVSAPDKFAALAGHEAMAALAGALGTLAGSLIKVANDVRWLASGRDAAWVSSRFRRTSPGRRSCRAR